MVDKNQKKEKPKRSPLKGSAALADVGNSVLAISMLYPETISEIELISEYFPLHWQQDTWTAIKNLYESKSQVDMVLVAERLTMMDAKLPADVKGTWLAFLADTLKHTVAVPENIQVYVNHLMGWQRRSRCYEIGAKLMADAAEGEDGSDEAIKDLMAMSTSVKIMDGPLSESVGEAVDLLDARAESKTGIHGVPYGIGGLDRCLAGMEKTHLIVLAARTSMGKTAAALCFCRNNRDRPVGFISTEQPRREMINRLVCIHGGIDGHRLRTGKLTNEEWARIPGIYEEISKWPMYMNDRPAPHLNDVLRQGRKWKQRYGMELLVVDYMQRIKVPGAERHEEVGSVARELKNLARELEIPVMALSQINRGVEARPNKRPVLSDLRESGDIEQEADVIITIYRDEVYHEDESGSNAGKVEFGIPKNRHGSTGVVHCHYEKAFFRFEDADIDRDILRELGPEYSEPGKQFPQIGFSYRSEG